MPFAAFSKSIAWISFSGWWRSRYKATVGDSCYETDGGLRALVEEILCVVIRKAKRCFLLDIIIRSAGQVNACFDLASIASLN
jgi:hypothetical protein